MNLTRKPKAMTLAEWTAKQEQDARRAVLAELADCARRQTASRVWDDPKNWR